MANTTQRILDPALSYGQSAGTRVLVRAVQLGACLTGGWFGGLAAAVIAAPHNAETERRIRRLGSDQLTVVGRALERGEWLAANFVVPGTLKRIVASELRAREAAPRG